MRCSRCVFFVLACTGSVWLAAGCVCEAMKIFQKGVVATFKLINIISKTMDGMEEISDYSSFDEEGYNNSETEEAVPMSMGDIFESFYRGIDDIFERLQASDLLRFQETTTSLTTSFLF